MQPTLPEYVQPSGYWVFRGNESTIKAIEDAGVTTIKNGAHTYCYFDGDFHDIGLDEKLFTPLKKIAADRGSVHSCLQTLSYTPMLVTYHNKPTCEITVHVSSVEQYDQLVTTENVSKVIFQAIPPSFQPLHYPDVIVTIRQKRKSSSFCVMS